MKTSFKSPALIGMLLLGSQSPALAQQASADEAEYGKDITVTAIQAYRGGVPLSELPQATQELSAELLEDLNITRLDDALDLSASVSRQNAFGGVFDAYAIRGFVGDPNAPSGVLVNGFNGARGYAGPRDASNVETIEILRGPTSALFGRGEPGGTINIVTKKPLFETQGRITASAGSFDTYRGEVDITGPLSETIAVRLTAAVEDSGSYRDTLNSEKYTTSPSILFQSGGTTAIYELELTRQKVPFDRGIPAIDGDPSVLPISRFLGEPEDGKLTGDVIGQQFQIQQELSDNWKLLAGVAYRVTDLKGFGQDPEFAAARQPFTIDGRTLSRRRIFRDYAGKDFIPRAELSGKFNTGPIRHNILFGGDYEWFKLDILQTRYRPPNVSAAQRAEILASNPSAATLLALNAIDIYNPVYQTPEQIASLPMSDFQSRIEVAKAWGVYLRDQIDINDWLKIQLGIRYDRYDQDVENRLNLVTTSQSFEKWSPSFAISAEVMSGLILYGSHSKGFRANTGVNFRNEAFRPEETSSYEAGVKFDVADDLFSGTIAVFEMKKSNVITADPVNAGFSIDVGEAKSRGVEVDIKARLPGDIQMVLSYAFVDAFVTDTILDPDFGRTINAGDPLINIPKNSLSVLLSRDFMIGERELTLGGTVRYVDERLGETATTYTLPSYTLVRLFGSIDITESIKLSADVNNLFNERYFPSSYAALWTMPGSPREYTARVSFSF